MQTIAGIDYGSKMAGTTAICYNSGFNLIIRQGEKKKDADQWLLNQVAEIQPVLLALDAPLSLPAKYFGKGEDYFYRAADRALKAMSPMFLGGLTARAMRLKELLETDGFQIIEAYPGALARELQLKDLDYKGSVKNVGAVVPKLLEQAPQFNLQEPPTNWHQVDALLAWLIGYRYSTQKAIAYGDKEEGQVFV